MNQSILKWFRLLADPARVRILLLLEKEELSVAELQEILSMGQSRISMSLSQLRQAGLVEDRRNGKHSLYRIHEDLQGNTELIGLLRQATSEISEATQDAASLDLALRKRRDRMRAYFDELAGKFGRHYVPGRSWKGIAEALLKLMPPMVVADLGAGEATLSQLLAQRAEKVIAVDNSEQMVAFGRDLASRHALANLEYRVGDLEQLPVEDATVDLAIFSQSLHHASHPPKAVEEAWRILKPGGRIVVLDLLRHNFEDARELYADLWLGFPEVELEAMLHKARFTQVETSIVYREPEPPHFETLLALGVKPR
ncbi:MAG: metalloregulator ArsR/SmtB family transcription factor [Acidobacteria bacterium]|nr:metalloregulator ArsR/SmtB family transcription factor [Acidobacteriota bacterium]